jgi:hypothetical protein
MCFINSCTITAFLAIALALDASHNANDNGDSELGGEFFFIITGLVSMTLLINGSTSGICLLYGIFSVLLSVACFASLLRKIIMWLDPLLPVRVACVLEQVNCLSN